MCWSSALKLKPRRPAACSCRTPPRKPQEAEVISVGTGGRDDKGALIEFTVKPGDHVLISKYGGTEIKLDGEDYLILSENDILAIIG